MLKFRQTNSNIVLTWVIFQINWVYATNSNCLNPISLQPNGVNSYFEISKVCDIVLKRYIRFINQSLWQRLKFKPGIRKQKKLMYFYKKGSTLGCFSNRALGETWEHILFSYLARQGGGGGRSGVYLVEKQGVWKQNSVGEDSNNKKEELKVREKIRNLKC